MDKLRSKKDSGTLRSLSHIIANKETASINYAWYPSGRRVYTIEFYEDDNIRETIK